MSSTLRLLALGLAGLATLFAAPRGAAAPGSWGTPERSPHLRGDRVYFSIEAPAEAEVYLIGDFNRWDPTATPLEHRGGGVWEVGLDLEAGEYRYKFIVDGQARLDPANPDEVGEDDGSISSRIRVLGNGRVSQSASWRRDPLDQSGIAFRPPGRGDFSIGAAIGFTRVDGTTFWAKPSYAPEEDYVPEFDSEFGYGWESERVNIEADLAQPIAPHRQALLGIHFTDGTAYQNPAEIGLGENTLSAMFLKHDWIDYYDMQGYEPYVRVRAPGQTSLRVGYADEKYSNLTTMTNWSFFSAGAEEFRPNPPLTLLLDPSGGGEGRLQAVRVEIVKDTRRARQIGTIGTYARGFMEFGRGDFNFNRWILDGRTYMRLGRPAHLAVRTQAGGRFGGDRLPSQKFFYVGGLGTVRGHSFFAQSGDFELLGNIEYTFVIDDLEHGVMFFYDAGTAWNSTVIDLEDSVVLQSLGFAFKSLDDDFQVGFAWPIGTIGGDLEVSVRLNRTF